MSQERHILTLKKIIITPKCVEDYVHTCTLTPANFIPGDEGHPLHVLRLHRASWYDIRASPTQTSCDKCGDGDGPKSTGEILCPIFKT